MIGTPAREPEGQSARAREDPGQDASTPAVTSGSCAGGGAVQAKWQAAGGRGRAGPPRKAGASSGQIGTCARGQRGGERQPLGGVIGVGGGPATAAGAPPGPGGGR